MADRGFTGRPPYPDEASAPAGIDMSVPTVARTYDALLGGKDNFAADREAAEAVERTNPGSKAMARENRAFLSRAVSYVAGELGVSQFLDLGSGLPTAENTHQVAQHVNPDARVVYVDIDPIVLTHGRAILADSPNTTVATSDLRDVETVLNAAETKRLIDFDQPVCLMLVSLPHCIPDKDDPWGLVRRYFDHFVPGSTLIMSHVTSDDAEAARIITEQIISSGMEWGRVRFPDEVERFFDFLDTVSPSADGSAEPVLVDCATWRNGEIAPQVRPSDPAKKIWEHSGVGVKR